MARSKPRRQRASSARHVPSVPDISSVWRVIARPELIGALLVVVAFAAIAYLVPPLAQLLPESRDRLVEALGIHAFTAALALAALGALIALRRVHWLWLHRRHVAGITMALVFVAGVLGRWHPHAQVGGAEFWQNAFADLR